MNTDQRDLRLSDNGYDDRSLFDTIFARCVPEAAAGQIWVVDVVREPGHYAKVAVAGKSGLNAAGRCIGPRGSRIREIENWLPGERISVINYDSDPVQYVTDALDVAVMSVTVTSKASQDIRAVVPVELFAKAIGRDAHNVRLASALTGWRIAICAPQCSARRHVHPRFGDDVNPSIWDAARRLSDSGPESRAG